MKERNRNYLIICAIVSFAFILYGNTIRNKYCVDDCIVTYYNPTIQKGIKGIPEIFTSLYSVRGNVKYGYRPVVKATYAIEYEFFGQNPHISHLINILIYAFTCVLLFFILKKLLTPEKYPDPPAKELVRRAGKSGFHGARDYNIIFPIAITSLFLAHPLHTEVVCSLKNRDELLSFLGCLIALHFFIRYAEKDKVKYILTGLFFYLFALLSKASAITFLAVYPLILYFFSDAKHKKILYIFLSVFVIAVIAHYGPKFYLPPASREKLFLENPLFYETNIWKRFATGFYSLIYYVKLLFYPHPLRFYYGYNMLPVVSWLNGWVIFSFIFHLSIFIYAIIKIKAKHILAFAILYYLVSISMFANIVKPVMGIVAERYLYASSLGFCIIIAYFIFIKSAKLSRTFQIAALIIILIPYTAKTIERNKHWKDFLTLYSHDIKYLEKSVNANDMLAGELLREINVDLFKSKDIAESAFAKASADKNKEKIDMAIKYYKQTIKIYPEYYSSYNALGEIYLMLLKQYNVAAEYFQKALKINPEFAKSSFNLGQCYEMLNNYPQAIKYYKNAFALNSEYITARSNLANLYNKMGDFETAVTINKEIMKMFPLSQVPYVNIGNYYLIKSDTITALLFMEKAFKKAPLHYELCISLHNYYKQKGDLSKADYYYDKAIEADSIRRLRIYE